MFLLWGGGGGGGGERGWSIDDCEVKLLFEC